MIVGFCATYGRPQLVANCLAMFERQSLPASERALIVLDDSGLLTSFSTSNVAVVAVADKLPSLPHKYELMRDIATSVFPAWTAAAIMDDDDIFGPDWLASHAKTLEFHHWSKPAQVYSTCCEPAHVLHPVREQADRPEQGAFRFWSSVAVSRFLLDYIDGFPKSERKEYDQATMSRLHAASPSVGRCDALPCGPQYVYGWGRSNHCSTGSDDGWYRDHQPMDWNKTVGEISPAMDSQTTAIYRNVWHDSPGS